VTAVRRSPELDAPRRATDLLEDVVARLLGAVAIFGCGVALLVGLTEFTATLQRSRVETATRSSVVPTAPDESRRSVLISGRGSPHLRISKMTTRRASAATANPVVSTRDGALPGPPTTAAQALGSGLASGLAVMMLDAALVSGAWWATRRATSAIDAAAWEREWALVEPQWRDLPR
jgi:hypothetical protein